MTLSLDKFKTLLGITDAAQETALQFILDDVTETILNYCNLNELPQGLENTAYRMAIDIYRAEGIGTSEAPAGDVASIKEGDTTVAFKQAASESYYTASVLKNYTVQLNRYRRLIRPCCKTQSTPQG